MRTAPAALGVLLTLAIGGAAAAQVVPTAAGREQEVTTAAQIDAWLRETPATAGPVITASRGSPASPWADGLASPLAGPGVPFDAPPIVRTMADGQVHGEVGGEVGTLGHGGYGVASAPLGKNGYVQVGVSSFEASDRARRFRGYGGRSGQTLSITGAWTPGRDRDEPWRRPDETPQK